MSAESQGDLETVLRNTMARCGPLSLEDVMAAAAAAYYAQGTAFGRDGDFITAPEISQTFGELLGMWAAVVWQGLGMPSTVRLVELGPGRGTLMRDAVRAARSVAPFYNALSVHLVETSPTLRVQQRQILTGIECVWHTHLEEVPTDAPLIILANEFFDALPIQQWCRCGDGWGRRLVDWDGDSFVFVTGSPEGNPAALWGDPFTRSVADLDLHEVVELCPDALDIMTMIKGRLADQRGALLALDYGYENSAPGDTLQALKGHKFHSPLADLGASDLTAHVDFGRLLRAASGPHTRTYGPLTQGRFLSALGIEARARRLMRHASSSQRLSIGQGVYRLINPAEMGILFKVIAVTDVASPPPPGFEVAAAS